MLKALLALEERRDVRDEATRAQDDSGRGLTRESRTSRALERISRRWEPQAPPVPEELPERTHFEPKAAKELKQALVQQEKEQHELYMQPRRLEDDHGFDIVIHQPDEDGYGDSSPRAAASPAGTGPDAGSTGSPAAGTAGGDGISPAAAGGGGGGGDGDKGRTTSGRPKGAAAANKKLLQHTWLRIDMLGRTSLLSTDKHRLALKLGVQPRDLRMLDAALASVSPQTILDRERAIVVNLGPIKCIITLEYVLVVNPGDETAKPFIQTLKDKLSNPMHVGKVISYPGLSQLPSVRSRMVPQGAWSGGGGGGGGGGGSSSGNNSTSGSHTAGQQAVVGLSFELKVLEICLDITVGAMDAEARELKDVIEPTLDDLTRQVRQQELDLLRKCKNRLTRLVKHVETIKEVLEKFLQDDEDMHRLNLTAQEMIMARQHIQALDDGHGSAGPTPRGISGGALGSRSAKRLSRRASLASSGGSSSSSSSSSSGHSMDLEEEAQVAEVEMLLEAYQMHLDHLFNKLQSLEQFVEDGEDLVNVSLDEHRNRIIAVDVIITAFATAMGLGTAVTGLFGVNIPYHDLISEAYENFQIIAIFGAVLGPLLIMGSFVGWAIYNGAVSLR